MRFRDFVDMCDLVERYGGYVHAFSTIAHRSGHSEDYVVAWIVEAVRLGFVSQDGYEYSVTKRGADLAARERCGE